jgi:hypothetical protein
MCNGKYLPALPSKKNGCLCYAKLVKKRHMINNWPRTFSKVYSNLVMHTVFMNVCVCSHLRFTPKLRRCNKREKSPADFHLQKSAFTAMR